MIKMDDQRTAYKVPIKVLKKGVFVLNEKEIEVLQTSWGNITRCNLIGIVVNILIKNNSFVLDDGTGSIQIKQFEQKIDLEKLSVGRIVNVVGRVQNYHDEKYVIADIIKETNQEWFSFRKKELASKKVMKEREEETINKEKNTNKDLETKTLETKKELELETKKTPNPPIDSTLSKPSQILEKIKQLDSGEGASIDDVADSFDFDADTIITNLMSEGELYEIKPGKIKVLE